ncbi:MAG: hypothetical protein ACM3SM_05325 [Bacteroidota bacterium]
MFSRLFSVLCIAVLLSVSVYAQDKRDSTDSVIIDTDSVEYNEEGDFDDNKFDDFESYEENKFEDFRFDGFNFKGKPSVELSYGLTENKIKSYKDLFKKNASAGVKLGYTKTFISHEFIVNYKHHYVFAGAVSKDLGRNEGREGMYEAEAWRFGLGSQDGYGYSIGKMAIIPFSSNSFVWTRLNFENRDMELYNSVFLNPELDMFEDAFRFGSMTEGGIKIQFSPLITLNASYERAIVFPRYMVWKHLGSFVIESAVLGGMELFTSKIMETSPAAGPIINFLLKNGFSYALYQLRHEKMNWPFSTAEPFAMDTFNFGVTFTF